MLKNNAAHFWSPPSVFDCYASIPYRFLSLGLNKRQVCASLSAFLYRLPSAPLPKHPSDLSLLRRPPLLSQLSSFACLSRGISRLLPLRPSYLLWPLVRWLLTREPPALFLFVGCRLLAVPLVPMPMAISQ